MKREPAPLSSSAKVARVILAAVLLALLLYICTQLLLGRGSPPPMPRDARSEEIPSEAPAAETSDLARPVEERSAVPPATRPTEIPQPALKQQPPVEGWEMEVCDDGTVRVLHFGAPILSATWNFWGANWQWQSRSITLSHEGPDRKSIYVGVPGLGLRITAAIESGPRNVLFYRFMMESDRDLKGITGGGLDFSLALDSPSFPRRPADPVILPGNRGWTWDTGGGRAMRVEFSQSMPMADFERHGNKDRIRALIVGTELAEGLHTFDMTITLPEGCVLVPSASERYGPADTGTWHQGALLAGASPVDLSFLNHTPAGAKGFVRAQGDALVFEDGTPARFWGGNLAAYALSRPNEEIEIHARRIAQLGYNLMRIHHHDSMAWVRPTVIDQSRDDSQHLNAEAMDRLDYLIKSLKEQGVYVWLDLHVGRIFKAGDAESAFGTIEGFDEITRHNGEVKGFCYFNETVQALMADFNAKYLSHVNPYTGLAYKDDPAVMGVLVTNENDLTHHFGNLMLPDKNNPVHNAVFQRAVKAFCADTGLPASETWKTWMPGPSKIFLNHQEHLFGAAIQGELDKLGLRVPVATTNSWGNMGAYSLPALAADGIVDVHSYGDAEAFQVNPRYAPNYVSWIVAAQVHGKPVSISEWNVPYPNADRFTAPLYMAGVACLQGWDAPMVYTYSQAPLQSSSRTPDQWTTFYDPAVTGIMPAAAIAYRQGHIAPARKTYCLMLDRQHTYYQTTDSTTSTAIRTLAETSGLTIGLPDIPELDWDGTAQPGDGVEIVTDPARDFIPPGQDYVESDTGELRRDWRKGIHTIDTPKTQAASGWIGGEKIALRDVRVEVAASKAVLAVTSLDDQPIRESRKILVTAIARVLPSTGGAFPFLSEPVTGTLHITAPDGMQVLALHPDGQRGDALPATYADGAYTVELDGEHGTHWFLVE
jgi:hypothetical protein